MNYSRVGVGMSLLLFALLFVNIMGYKGIEFIRSFMGFSSLSLPFFIVCSIYNKLWNNKKIINDSEKLLFHALVSMVGVVSMANILNLHTFYTKYEIYSLGYTEHAWMICACLIGIVFMYSYKLAGFLFVALLSWHFQLTTSNNFFDYISDIFIFIISVTVLMKYIFQKIRVYLTNYKHT